MTEEIAKKILADAEKQKKAILGEAQEERAERLDAAKIDIKREEARLVAKGRQEAAREKQRLVSEANLEAKRNLLAAKEELIKSVVLKSSERLEAYTKDSGYGRTLDKFADECKKELGKGANLFVRKEDTKYLGGSKEREMGPGVIGESKDGGLYFDNTFGMRLERKQGKVRKAVGGLLFK